MLVTWPTQESQEHQPQNRVRICQACRHGVALHFAVQGGGSMKVGQKSTQGPVEANKLEDMPWLPRRVQCSGTTAGRMMQGACSTINQVNQTITVPNERQTQPRAARGTCQAKQQQVTNLHMRAMQHSRPRISTSPAYAVYRRCARLRLYFSTATPATHPATITPTANPAACAQDQPPVLGPAGPGVLTVLESASAGAHSPVTEASHLLRARAPCNTNCSRDQISPRISTSPAYAVYRRCARLRLYLSTATPATHPATITPTANPAACAPDQPPVLGPAGRGVLTVLESASAGAHSPVT